MLLVMQNKTGHCILQLHTVDKLLGEHTWQRYEGYESNQWHVPSLPYSCRTDKIL